MNRLTDERIEKAAREYADKNFVDDADKLLNLPWPEAQEVYIRALVNFAAFALSHQWVSVDEAVPRDNRTVIVKCKVEDDFIDPDYVEDLSYTVARYSDGGWCLADDWYYDCKVLAWLQIPQLAPKKNKS